MIILLLFSFCFGAIVHVGPGQTYTSINTALSTEGGQNTFIIHDDTYAENITSIPSGTSGTYTILQADNDGGVNITGGLTIGNNYIKIEGLKFTDTGETEITGQYIKILRTAFNGGPGSGNSVSLLINATSYVLLEDCWVYGSGGRYKVLVFQSDYVVLRRVLARHDGGWQCDGSNPEAGIQIYNSADCSVQNCIVIDTHDSSCPLGNFSTTRHNNPPYTKLNTNNSWLGCMVINGSGLESGFIGDLDANGNQTITDFLVLGADYGFSAGSDPGTFNFNRASILASGGDIGMGSWGSASVTATNVIVSGFSNDDFDGVSPTYFDTYNNGESQSGTGQQTYNPESNGWLYPVRIELGSNLKTDGSAGGQIGAQIVTKIGASESLYGEANYNADTAEELWPWPNEARIRADLVAVADRGFCANGETLTNYIMNYLGNGNPYSNDITSPTATGTLTANGYDSCDILISVVSADMDTMILWYDDAATVFDTLYNAATLDTTVVATGTDSLYYWAVDDSSNTTAKTFMDVVTIPTEPSPGVIGTIGVGSGIITTGTGEIK